MKFLKCFDNFTKEKIIAMLSKYNDTDKVKFITYDIDDIQDDISFYDIQPVDKKSNSHKRAKTVWTVKEILNIIARYNDTDSLHLIAREYVGNGSHTKQVIPYIYKVKKVK